MVCKVGQNVWYFALRDPQFSKMRSKSIMNHGRAAGFVSLVLVQNVPVARASPEVDAVVKGRFSFKG